MTVQALSPHSIDDLLTWSRNTVDPHLRAAVDHLPEPLRHICGYHFGWRDASGKAVQGKPGKALRPALTLLTARAVGGDAADAIPAAVAVELAHNFSLLHDDVMDRDRTRRHQPTAWTVFGTSEAILAGDALLAQASHTLAPAGGTAVQWLNDAVIELCQGQAQDLAFERRTDVVLDECVMMAQRKTSALLEVSCALGALAGGADEATVHLMRAFGRHLGLAFQLVDDLLGIWGSPSQTGKPAHSDLANRKKSLPVVAALTSKTPHGHALGQLYLTPAPPNTDDLGYLADLVEKAGGREWASTRATDEIEKAMDCLARAQCERTTTATLHDIALHLTKRDH
ncbi:family 2 encapsulin nanocompartment cargo protein polyprenyl transferase [Kutzneria sp. NPDC052558]|uniref:family 2 encapsulin nanocompartment cargo protein polyprenyl transferase n=1 Tax=Kutzneria sp. NPDC052558 TaxID=3364121 RepID=UPI0037CADF83